MDTNAQARPRASWNCSRGFDASLRSALGAITGLVILLGLDGIDDYGRCAASMVASGVVSYALLEPLNALMSGHREAGEAPPGGSAARHVRLLARLMSIAALAVAAHELFVRGVERMESPDAAFTFQEFVHFGPFVVPILVGIFSILGLTTWSWMLGDEFVRASRPSILSITGACSGALVSAVYFLLRARSPANIFVALQWPDEAARLLIAAHVGLAALLGLAGGSVIAQVTHAARRMVWIALALAAVTFAWCAAVYLVFDHSYEGLLEWKVFRCHVVVVSGWIVGLMAGPLGRSESERTLRARPS